MARLFFALWPNDEVRKELAEISDQFKDEKFRLTKISNLHITLAFLGEVSEQEQTKLVEQANNIKSSSFSLKLNSIGHWKKPGILWLAPEEIPEALKELVEQLQTLIKQQGLNIDERPYKPHVTIARKVKQFTIPEVKFHIPWSITSFALVVSKSSDIGVEYHILQKWMLHN
jgi:RNA 2',3'-cyclic 3'-phosphodiesterase